MGDTRSTGGDIVANKNCEKLHFMAPNIYCAGAGTAADCDKTTGMISSQLELHRLNTGRQVRVIAAQRMVKQMLFRYQGHIGTYLIMGGGRDWTSSLRDCCSWFNIQGSVLHHGIRNTGGHVSAGDKLETRHGGGGRQAVGEGGHQSWNLQ